MKTNTQTKDTRIKNTELQAPVTLLAETEGSDIDKTINGELTTRDVEATFDDMDNMAILNMLEESSQPEPYLENGCFVFNDNPTRPLIPLLHSIEGFVEQVLSTDEEFTLVSKDNRSALQVNELTKVFQSMDIELLEIKSNYIYSERVKLFSSAFDSIGLLKSDLSSALHKGAKCLRSKGYDVNAAYTEQLVTALNTFISKIRALGKETGIKRKIATRKHNSVRNYNSITSFIDELYDNHSRLLVLRVDLGYGKGIKAPTLEEAQSDFTRFKNNIRTNRRFKDLVGYVWKLELGALKGFHYHLILFFDGSKVKNDYFYASEIGTYWKEVITKQRGTYFNCNGSKQKKKYRVLAIGMINHNDFQLRQNLNSVVAYITKGEQYLAIKLTKKARIMGKSLIKPKCTRGRPRATKIEGAVANIH